MYEDLSFIVVRRWRERERVRDRVEEREGERRSGLSMKPWQRQTDSTILWGRFNYKWCFHLEPSWNPLFFRRSSSPNPQQGLVWPASQVICLTHIVYHTLWMMGRRHSCPNFAESSVNINTRADRMLIFDIERRTVLNQVLQNLGVEVSQLFICKVRQSCLWHLRLTLLHLCCPFFVCLLFCLPNILLHPSFTMYLLSFHLFATSLKFY